jgi:multiple sugar transport system permease protein
MYDIPALFNVTETGLVGLPDDKTTTMSMYIMRLYNSDVGKAAAVSVILFVVTLIVSLLLFASMSDKEEKRIKKQAKLARKAGDKA